MSNENLANTQGPLVSKLNRTAQMIAKLKSFPFGDKLVNLVIGRTIPFVATGRLQILKMEKNEVIIKIKNQRAIRNHIGQVHAAAMLLLAETCSGLLVGMNVKDECLPLVKSIESHFVKRSSGALVARAYFDESTLEKFLTDKGEMPIEVEVTDEAGIQPVRIICIWAWIPKLRKT